MLFRQLATLILFCCSFALPGLSQSDSPKKVLFVGNSYTYFWNLPQVTAAMMKAKKQAFTTQQSTAGGAHWGHHWRNERGLETKRKIQEGDYDIVVLQNHSRSTIDRPDSLMHFGRLFDQMIKKSGAQTYLYLTWARSWDPYMQAPIKAKYMELAEKIGATIVPVGPAWERARSLRPELEFYDPDGSHPSTLGTYLTACVFYGVITGESPVGLPSHLSSKDEEGEFLFLNIQSAETALFCQKVAEEIINKWREK